MKFKLLFYYCYSNMSQLHVLQFVVRFCPSVIALLSLSELSSAAKFFPNLAYAVVKLFICWFFRIVSNTHLILYDGGHVIYVVTVLRLKLQIKD